MSAEQSTPSVFLSDPDVTLYHGDVLETLRELPAESVDSVVTSPPYWGLRDYGTGEWEGGDQGCDHKQGMNRQDAGRAAVDGFNGSTAGGAGAALYRDTCGKCGARRIDQQLGLEPTPDCGKRGMYRLRSDLSEAQREFVLQRLLAVEGRPDA